MPPNISPVHLGSRTSYVCQSCIRQLRASRSAKPWALRTYSEDAAKAQATPEQPTQTQRKQPQPSIAELLLSRQQKREDHNTKIRYYQQEGPGKFRQLRDEEEFSEEFNGLEDDAKSTVADLEERLRETEKLMKLFETHAGKRKTAELKRLYESSSPADLEKLASNGGIDLDGLHISGEGLKKQGHAVHTRKLSYFLKERAASVARGDINASTISSAWRYYAAARKGLSTSWGNVPPAAWAEIWKILAWDGADNPNKMTHINVLARDMRDAGAALTDEQTLLAIEAAFIEGWRKEAIEGWKKAVGIASTQELANNYWELGVRMFCLEGDLDRAERAINKLLDSSAKGDPRILVPYIRACIKKEGISSSEKEARAWGAYQRMRDLLGEDMRIEDYDEVVACFLATHRTESALQIFVDMMFSGAVDLRRRKELPLSVSNQFFLGKWLKRLIGASDLDGAFEVLKYMESKGIMAASIHVNGLIGAWLRSETAENAAKAEALAWSMIRSRLLWVDLRRREAWLDWPIKLETSLTRDAVLKKDIEGNDFLLKLVPRANLETFSLMAENYRTRRLHGRLQKLWSTFRDAEIGADSFMMNQVIESCIQSGEAEQAVEVYQLMTGEHHVPPDAHTFLLLFKSLSVNRLLQKREDLITADKVMCRELFRDLVQASWVFDSAWIYDNLPRMILHSFLRLEDYAGLFVALRTMRVLFNLQPNEALLLELTTGAMNLNSASAAVRHKIMTASRDVEHFVEQRQKELADKGQSFDNMTATQKADALTTIMERYLLWKAGLKLVDLEPQLVPAAEEMGVYDILIRPNPKRIARTRKGQFEEESS